ncbi:hypothetical protein [Falsibacillus albus]|uniref:Uncharacterized protein n=1 Tax=Falsibacillus albus TaxID=2478915 RepID=A0A3L7JSJ0_9BACI|nr:hypothetical protein [Falsibacillus albus]RLQ93666.1 hypothetical protein D9X91_16930 [Falsibacillus albus]
MKKMLTMLVIIGMSIGGKGVFAAGQQVDLSGVTYIKSETTPDHKLEEAFSKEFNLKPGESNIHYFYNHIDLNGDNVPETFVYLTGREVCGTGGCSAMIYRQSDAGKYQLVSRFSLVRTPVIIEDATTKGWKNIIMYVSGGGMEGRYKILPFNGKAYPSNPSVQPDVKDDKITGVGIINDDLSKNPGIPY